MAASALRHFEMNSGEPPNSSRKLFGLPTLSSLVALCGLTVAAILSACGTRPPYALALNQRSAVKSVAVISLLDHTLLATSESPHPTSYRGEANQWELNEAINAILRQELQQSDSLTPLQISYPEHDLLKKYQESRTLVNQVSEQNGFDTSAEALQEPLRFLRDRFHPDLFVIVLPARAKLCLKAEECADVGETGYGIVAAAPSRTESSAPRTQNASDTGVSAYMAIKLNLIDPRTLQSIAHRRFVWSVEIPNLPWRDSFGQYSVGEQTRIEQAIKTLFDQRARETLQAVNLIPPTAITRAGEPRAQLKEKE